jgi:hypothetical protein
LVEILVGLVEGLSVTEKLIDGLTDRLADGLTDGLTDGLADGLTDGLGEAIAYDSENIGSPMPFTTIGA